MKIHGSCFFKIYIAGVLADEMETAYNWIVEDKEAFLYFKHVKQVTGKTRECQDLWGNALRILLREQHITLDKLVTAEIVNERRKFDKKMNLANIMQTPKTALTEEDTKAIVERATLGKATSVPASLSGSSKWGKAAGTVPAATPKAAPAVIRTIVKAPPERPPRQTRLTPPNEPPAKRQKPAAEQIPYSQKAGKGKGSKSRPGSFDDKYQGWHRDPRNRGHQQSPDPPPYRGKGRQEPQNDTREYLMGANAVRDVRETDRLNRGREERERVEAEQSEAYNEWWSTAWQPSVPSVRPNVGYEESQSYFSRADSRDYERYEHPRADNRSSSAWTPSVPPAGSRLGRNRTRSPYVRRAFSPGRRLNHENQDDWEPRRAEPAPRNPQWDWDEDQRARANERSRRHKWSGR